MKELSRWEQVKLGSKFQLDLVRVVWVSSLPVGLESLERRIAYQAGRLRRRFLFWQFLYYVCNNRCRQGKGLKQITALSQTERTWLPFGSSQFHILYGGD